MPEVHALGEVLVGHVKTAELAEGMAEPLTRCHGDASLRNVFSSPSGEIAFVDWEDVRCGAGIADVAWLLVSLVAPTEWDDVIDAYGPTPASTTYFVPPPLKASCRSPMWLRAGLTPPAGLIGLRRRAGAFQRVDRRGPSRHQRAVP